LDEFNLKKGQKLDMIVRDDGIHISLAQKKNNVKEIMGKKENSDTKEQNIIKTWNIKHIVLMV
jgi:bifunctional DNA-binding transcriptional regulator/antitoxin component of YhaV-PrlF toxin-antitoxin module